MLVVGPRLLPFVRYLTFFATLARGEYTTRWKPVLHARIT